MACVRCQIRSSRTRNTIAAPWVSSLFTATKRIVADRFGIGRVVFVTHDERLGVGWRDEPNVMAQVAYLTAPKVGAAAGFHRDHARRQPSEVLKDLIPSHLLAKHCPARAIGPMRLEHILRQIEPDRDNL